MKKRLVTFGLISSVILALFGFTMFTHAEENSVAVIEKNKVYEGNYYSNKDEVKIKGEIKGTLYAYAAKKIEVSGKIDGDIVAASPKIFISGEVSGDTRVAAQNVNLDGVFKKDVSVAALQTKIGEKSNIDGDFNAYGANIVVDGTVQGGAVLQAFNAVQSNGKIVGDAYIDANILDLGKKAKFENNLSYKSVKDVEKIEDKTKGKVDRRFEQKHDSNTIVGQILSIAASFIVMWLVIMMLAPRFFERSRVLTKNNFGKTFLYGMSILFLPWIIAVLLLITYFGSFLSILIIIVWVLIMMVSGAFFSYLLGSFFFRGSNNVLIRGIAGSVVGVLLFFIPFINIVAVPLLLFLGAVVGSGMFMRTLLENNQGPGLYVKSLEIDNVKDTKKDKKTIENKSDRNSNNSKSDKKTSTTKSKNKK